MAGGLPVEQDRVGVAVRGCLPDRERPVVVEAEVFDPAQLDRVAVVFAEVAGEVAVRSAPADRDLFQGLCVPITSSMSCDQVIFVDHATEASVSSDAVIVEMDRFG